MLQKQDEETQKNRGEIERERNIERIVRGVRDCGEKVLDVYCQTHRHALFVTGLYTGGLFDGYVCIHRLFRMTPEPMRQPLVPAEE